MNDRMKSAVSLSDLARQLNLSRQRLHQLVQAGTFPPPVYDVRTRRPFYTEELQRICLEVRQRNFGSQWQADSVLCKSTTDGIRKRTR